MSDRRSALRLLTALAGSAAVFRPLHAAAADPWQIVKLNGRDYVTTGSIHKFYRFSSIDVSQKYVAFKSPNLVMTAYVNSQTLVINKIKFITSFPVIRHEGKVLISRTDLSKLIDPILRPSYIQSPSSFDTVVVDAGHGGHDPGARGRFGNEASYTLDTALQLKQALEKHKLKVHLTRSRDTFIPLSGRVEIANRFPKAIFVSVHFNSGQSQAQGIETFALTPQGSSSTMSGQRRSDYSEFRGNRRDSENIALATAVHASAIHRLKVPDRGVKRARWTVLTGLKLPGILFEGGFVTNASEAAQINTSTYRKQIASAMAEGIRNFRKALS
ncbi:MAG TPA: N-acetylmuramoyl-L-alanine amidase [Verrucomicrobiales bacterium]|nr:N-acetylmuramoyl-L-alanine amidase [Verrucomicrobiales bacterium]